MRLRLRLRLRPRVLAGRAVTGQLLVRSRGVVTAAGVLDGGWVRIAGDTVLAVGTGDPPLDGAEIVDASGALVLPGLIDLHAHGGAGVCFDDGGPAIVAGLALHRAHGTTRSLVSLMTAPIGRLTVAIAAAAEYAATDPTVLGLHLEGPFLAASRRGVHDPAALLEPDLSVLADLLGAGDGRIAVVTLAPERPGGLELVRALVDGGVRPSVGHSDADYEQARRAFRAGAVLVTHAFNGMRPLHHRDPAIIGAAMDAGVVLEAINDGVHLHPATVRLLRALAPGRVALVTDAMAAAGHGDGHYRLGSFDVRVSGGVARLVESGAIAGSTLTLDAAVRRAVADGTMTLPEAVAAASSVPARVLGLSDRFGSLAPGRTADLVFVDRGLSVQAVMVGGRWWDDRRPAGSS